MDAHCWDDADNRLMQMAAESLGEYIRRQRSEALLRNNEKKYRSLIENQGEGIVTFEDDVTFTFAKRVAHEIFNSWDGELLGHHLKEFVTPEDFMDLRDQVP
jgi:PAS domain-containing protein